MTADYRKDPEAISKLDKRQYAVTQEGATEPAFDNNSAALRFVPYEELEAQGYGRYKSIFEKPGEQEEVAR